MSAAPVIHWFRRDLRADDNTALFAALESGSPVITVFVFDPIVYAGHNAGAARVAFMLGALVALADQLAQLGGRLLLLQGDPLQQLPALVQQTNAAALFFNNDYTPYATRRDAAIVDALSIPVYRFDDAVIQAPGRVLTGANKPYTVFTPFKNRWRELSQQRQDAPHPRPNGQFSRADGVEGRPLPTLAELGHADPGHPIPASSAAAAQAKLARFADGPILAYAERRNRLEVDPFGDHDTPTSAISPYLRLGLLSPRQAVQAARDAYASTTDTSERHSVNVWVDELIWREFYLHILFHFPHVARGNFNPAYDAVAWRDAPDDFARWAEGTTGYPIVDAAMRQLRAVGWLPNRARMIVGSFLCKDLLIHHGPGQHHFMLHLMDGDPAANNGGWQWVASTGTDAQPYFRIFNPVTQSEKFDPDGAFIRHWLPELAHLSNKEIHAPWQAKQPPANYPAPIIDHGVARQRTLAAFEAARRAEPSS